jgi:hypothetical protein
MYFSYAVNDTFRIDDHFLPSGKLITTSGNTRFPSSVVKLCCTSYSLPFLSLIFLKHAQASSPQFPCILLSPFECFCKIYSFLAHLNIHFVSLKFVMQSCVIVYTFFVGIFDFSQTTEFYLVKVTRYFSYSLYFAP